MYQESWLRMQKNTPGLISYEDRALYSTWDISYTQVEQQNTASARLLRLWAYFGNQDLWFELLLTQGSVPNKSNFSSQIQIKSSQVKSNQGLLKSNRLTSGPI